MAPVVARTYCNDRGRTTALMPAAVSHVAGLGVVPCLSSDVPGRFRSSSDISW